MTNLAVIPMPVKKVRTMSQAQSNDHSHAPGNTRPAQGRAATHRGGRTTGLVFPCRAYRGKHRPLRNSNVLKWGLHPILRELEIPMAGMHAFRHYRVTALMESNIPLERSKHGSVTDRK
jgi:hypothetical protein